jgi:hypothetical protein
MNLLRIIDVGRGPQLSGSRITALDVFYYLHRVYDFDFIQRAIPSLTRAHLEVYWFSDNRSFASERFAKV